LKVKVCCDRFLQKWLRYILPRDAGYVQIGIVVLSKE
jgi:hypothetical protein